MIRRAPGFWSAPPGLGAAALAPLSAVVAAITVRRANRPGWRAPVPVLCCGNATLGGAGKTPLALDLLARLIARGRTPHALLRGHGGRSRGVRPVRASDSAALVGDEALLLAGVAPTWIGADRAAAARAALKAGADLLVLDDGLQNPGLAKTAALLVIDGGAGFGNGRVLPAGPLREPVATAARRCAVAVLIGDDRHAATAALPPTLPVLTAHLQPDAAMRALAGTQIVAFAGIGRPGKFFDSLRQAGADLAAEHAFPDHHPYTEAEAARLRAAQLPLVTTYKDAVRLPPSLIGVAHPVGVRLVWDDPAALALHLDRWLAGNERLTAAEQRRPRMP